jgi:hypothetical protein
LNQSTTNETNILKQLQDEYNSALSDYSTKYTSFMQEYYKYMDNLKVCKTKCLQQIPVNAVNSIEKREACKAGCDFKGPYILQCASTYKGSKTDRSKKCSDMIVGKCSNNKVVLGQDSYVESNANADYNNVTLKDGCCECGGGLGGPPKSVVRGKKIASCNNVWSAFYNRKNLSASTGVINACKNAVFMDSNKAQLLYVSYNDLVNSNNKLMKLAGNIFEKIKKLKNIDKTLYNKIKGQEQHLEKQISLFGDTFLKLKNLDKSGSQENATLIAQLEDIRLKKNSTQITSFVWGSLAILIFVTTIRQLSK